LALDDEDLNDLRKCRPPVIAGSSSAGRKCRTSAQPRWQGKPSGNQPCSWRSETSSWRARAYLDGGLAGIPPYHDRKTPVSPAAESDDIAAHLGFLPLYGGRVPRYLQSYPDTGTDAAESFLYW
jgi:hypothetical protein